MHSQIYSPWVWPSYYVIPCTKPYIHPHRKIQIKVYKNNKSIKHAGDFIILVYNIHIFSSCFKAEPKGNLSQLLACLMYHQMCFSAWYYTHATGREGLNAMSFALIAWIQIGKYEDASDMVVKRKMYGVTQKLQVLTSFSQFIESTIHTSNKSFVRLPQTMPSQSPYWKHNKFSHRDFFFRNGESQPLHQYDAYGPVTETYFM
jgi:hypothetical protein